MKPTPERLNELWATPSNWRSGCFYYCPEDPRMIVPKRMKWMGWTTNFARPLAVPVLLGIGVLAAAPLLYLEYAGYGHTWIWWTALPVVIALVCAICWYFSSAERYRDLLTRK